MSDDPVYEFFNILSKLDHLDVVRIVSFGNIRILTIDSISTLEDFGGYTEYRLNFIEEKSELSFCENDPTDLNLIFGGEYAIEIVYKNGIV